MIFTTITGSEVQEGKPVTNSLLTKIKDSLDDLNVRLIGTDVDHVTTNTSIATRTTPYFALGETTSGNVTISLPPAANMENRYLQFKKITSDGNNFILDPSGSELIENASTYTMTRQYDSATIISNGTTWYVATGIQDVGYVQGTTTISTTYPLQGGGDLSANRTFSIATDSLTDTYFNSSAAIAYSKLNLTGSIVNADVSASAAIAYSKLNLATSIVNADIAATSITKTKLSLAIVNADIAAGTGITLSKLATITASRGVATDGSGFNTASATSATQIGYTTGLTSNAQTQVDGKASKNYDTSGGNYTYSGSGTETPVSSTFHAMSTPIYTHPTYYANGAMVLFRVAYRPVLITDPVQYDTYLLLMTKTDTKVVAITGDGGSGFFSFQSIASSGGYVMQWKSSGVAVPTATYSYTSITY